MIKKTLVSMVGVSLSFLVGASSLLAAQGTRSEMSIENTPSSSGRHFLLDPVELTPVTGFTVVDSSAGFNLGAHGAYPVIDGQPLYLEPSLILGFFSSRTMFNLTGAMRYDISLPDTKVRPFVRAGLGPTFQTSGDVAIFNATFGGGVLFPVSSSLELRAEAALVDLGGSAGFQLMGGVSL